MQRELTTEAAQVFEPGARVAWRGTTVPPRVLARVEDGRWVGVSDHGEEVTLASETTAALNLEFIAPSPRAGQRWTGSGHPLFIGKDGGELVCQEVLEGPEFRGDAVAVARLLLASGYSFAGLASEPTPAPPPITSLEPPRSPDEPTPWTRDDARRLILATIADTAPRRPAAFTSALCSLAELFTTDAYLILATARALAVLEEELPERGTPMAWHVDRATERAGEAFERAAQLDRVLGVVEKAFRIYLDRRATC